jgi:acyl-CoA dehydrogenase
VNTAGQAAALALDQGLGWWEVAAAKLRTNMAIGSGAAIAHQVHGAIGFTQDHALHRFTGPLTRWRSAYGGDRYWSGVLGDLACAAGGAGLWAALTRRTDGSIRNS